MIDAGHTSTNHAMSHFNMNHDINFSSAADSVTTQELIEELDILNHLVDDLTIGSMIELRSVNYVSNPPPTLDNTLARKIIELNLNSSQAREKMCPFIDSATRFSKLFTTTISGVNFIFRGCLRRVFEPISTAWFLRLWQKVCFLCIIIIYVYLTLGSLFFLLVPADKYDPDVIQVWRSLAAEAVFEMNGNVDVDTLARMLSTAQHFGDTLTALFPEDSGPLLGGEIGKLCQQSTPCPWQYSRPQDHRTWSKFVSSKGICFPLSTPRLHIPNHSRQLFPEWILFFGGAYGESSNQSRLHGSCAFGKRYVFLFIIIIYVYPNLGSLFFCCFRQTSTTRKWFKCGDHWQPRLFLKWTVTLTSTRWHGCSRRSKVLEILSWLSSLRILALFWEATVGELFRRSSKHPGHCPLRSNTASCRLEWW